MSQENICLRAFKKGAAERQKYPLEVGAYKLDEAAHVGDVVFENLCELTECQRQRRKMYCMNAADQVPLWLKNQPEWLAYTLSWKVLPAIKCLRADGVPDSVINKHYPWFERRARGLTDELEAARLELKRGIKPEYDRLRHGDSLLLPVLRSYMSIIDDAHDLMRFAPKRVDTTSV